KILATTVYKKEDVCLWDVATGKLLRCLTVPGKKIRFASATFSPDGKHLCAARLDASGLVIWDLATGNVHGLRNPGVGSEYLPFTYSPDGKLLAVKTPEVVFIWDLDTGKLRASDAGHMGEIWALVFNPAGDRLATSGGDGTARLWDANTGKLLHILRHDHSWV